MDNRFCASVTTYIQILLSIIILLLFPLFIIIQLPTIKLLQSLSFQLEPSLFDATVTNQVTLESYQIVSQGKILSPNHMLNQLEIAHLQDVFSLVRLAMAGWIGSILVFLMLLKLVSTTFDYIFTRVINVLFVIIIALLIGLINFEYFFLTFHQLFFPQGNWSFPEESVLIQTFPPVFWMLCLSLWVTLILCFSLIGNILSKRYHFGVDRISRI